MDALIPLCFGIGLSAACGFRIFVPPLILSLVAQQGRIDLPANLAWLDDPLALAVLGAATVIEILAYYIPVVDNLTNAIEAPIAAIVGTLLTSAFLGDFNGDLNPVLQWTLAAIAGGGTASIVEGATGVSRLMSVGLTGGLANPIVSTIELLSAAVLSLLSLLVPLLAAVLVIGLLVFALRQIFRAGRRLLARRERDPSSKLE